MTVQEIAAIQKKANAITLDDAKNGLLHVTALKQTAANGIAQLVTEEKRKQDAISILSQTPKKSITTISNQIKAEIDSLMK